jgi:hypothetical protein
MPFVMAGKMGLGSSSSRSPPKALSTAILSAGVMSIQSSASRPAAESLFSHSNCARWTSSSSRWRFNAFFLMS